MPDLTYVPLLEFRRVRQMPVPLDKRASLFADLCRLNALYMIARAGSGHIGSSFCRLDVVAWLFLGELRLAGASPDLYFSSKGHDVPGLYAVLIGMGLLDFERLHTLRRLGGLPGHPDVGTPHMAANSGPLGMGIAKAKGMAFANRRNGSDSRIFVMTGDGELQEGQVWESLQSAANLGLGEITVIVDHNKVQSDTLVSRVSDLGDLEAKFSAFGWQVARCAGHDPAAIGEALAYLRRAGPRPRVLIADTIKGSGVSFMEHTAMQSTDRLYRFHSGAPDDETYRCAAAELIEKINGQLSAAGAPDLALETYEHPPRPSVDGKQRLIAAYGRALVEQAAANQHLVVLDADLALDCGLLPFEERFPERFVECGIAEQDMVSQAGGMALRGLLPVVHSFACFLSTRPNEQIYNNATERTKIIYAGSLAGLLPGGPGHSHQSVRDISALGAIPGLTLIEPANEREVAMALDYAVNNNSASTYLRLVSIPCAVNYELPEDYQMAAGRGVTLVDGTDACVIGYGPVLLPEAVRASKILSEKHGLSLRVVNLPWLNEVDADWLRTLLAGCRWLFTLDNHYLAGGQGEMIGRCLSELHLQPQPQFLRFGLSELPACGQNDEVLRYHRLDGESLAEVMRQAMQADERPHRNFDH